MASQLSCEQCGQPMGVAEAVCSACGQPAPLGRSARVYLQKAASLASDHDYEEALALADKAFAAGMDDADRVGALQRVGGWHERLADGNAMDPGWREAEECYRKALAMDDGNEALHQLWIANLSQAGRGQEALGWYEKRLQLNPADEVALRFRSVAKLTLEYQQQDFASEYRKAEPKARTRMEKIFKPTRANLVGTAFMGGLCLVVAGVLEWTGEAAGEHPVGIGTLLEPNSWILFSMVFFAMFGILAWIRK